MIILFGFLFPSCIGAKKIIIRDRVENTNQMTIIVISNYLNQHGHQLWVFKEQYFLAVKLPLTRTKRSFPRTPDKAPMFLSATRQLVRHSSCQSCRRAFLVCLATRWHAPNTPLTPISFSETNEEFSSLSKRFLRAKPPSFTQEMWRRVMQSILSTPSLLHSEHPMGSEAFNPILCHDGGNFSLLHHSKRDRNTVRMGMRNSVFHFPLRGI